MLACAANRWVGDACRRLSTREAAMAVTPATAKLPRLLRDQWHLFFDPNEKPKVRVPSGARLVVETEDAHIGSIRTDKDVYQSLAEVFEKLGGANPVTGPIYVEG